MQPARQRNPKGGDSMDTQFQQTPEASGSQALKLLRTKMKDGTLKDVIRDWKWILSFTRGRWPRIALYTLLGILSSCLGLITGITGKYLIDCIVTLDKARLPLLAVLTVITGAVSVVISSATARYSARLNITMRNDVQAHVFSNLLHAKWLELRRFPTGELLSRFSADVNTVSGCAVNWLSSVIIQVFTVLATLCVVLYYDPVMALIAFASTPVLILTSRRLLRRQRSFNMQLRQVSGGMSAFEAETFRNIDTLKSFGVEDDTIAKLGIWQNQYRDVALEHNAFTIKTNILLTALGTAVQYLALGYCLWQLWSGKILIGTMVLFLQQRSTLSSAFSSLISLIPSALSGSVAAERIRELTELEKEESCGTKARVQGSCALELDKVSASYEDGRQVLREVSLRADRGRIAALVGPSGEGKSTLIRLILGLIAPDSGTACLTDEAGSRFPLGADTRHLFAYVPQGNTVLAGTIAENLRLVNQVATEEQLIQALKDACAWEFVSQLPQGIHSPIGEGGKGFSEGQAQRIAIARALVRNAPVLLLDEVTSALDPDRGRIAALVGPSGEGKSTLIRLILGLIAPDSGTACLTDEAGSRFPLGADTRHLFAYVPQGNTVLAGTIAENLRLVNQVATEEQLIQALKDACAWEFVSQLPQGIHSPIGEGGKGFSEGQAQRIAIARALVRNAPVLLLDEVTSALDLETERQVLQNLMSRGLTCLVATHRPSVLNLCSRVYKVSEGSISQLDADQIQALIQFEK